MRAGKLRHKVTIQSPAGSRDATTGERVTTWTAEATTWASITPLSSNTIFTAAQANMKVTHSVVIRYSSDVSDIDGSWRVLFGSRPLVINGIRNINERNRTMELLCEEGLKDE